MAECNLSMVSGHGGHRVLIEIDDAQLETPPLEHVVFYAGVGVLVGVGLMELPVALALTVGHLLIGLTNRPGLEALGEVIEEV
jgi:hypothetical protein